MLMFSLKLMKLLKLSLRSKLTTLSNANFYYIFFFLLFVGLKYRR